MPLRARLRRGFRLRQATADGSAVASLSPSAGFRLRQGHGGQAGGQVGKTCRRDKLAGRQATLPGPSSLQNFKEQAPERPTKPILPLFGGNAI